MKKETLAATILTYATTALAHGEKEGSHHEETGILESTEPVAAALTLGFSALGVLMLAVSVRKYRKDS